jgi:hypothetical protein
VPWPGCFSLAPVVCVLSGIRRTTAALNKPAELSEGRSSSAQTLSRLLNGDCQCKSAQTWPLDRATSFRSMAITCLRHSPKVH